MQPEIILTMSANDVRALVRSTLAELLAEQEGRDQTIAEFCRERHMSLTTYYKMRKAGYGPDEVRIPGMAFTRITPQARAEWAKKIEKLRHNEARQLEDQRRSALASKAGKIAGRSPLHVSRRTKQQPAAAKRVLSKKKAMRR